MNLPSQTTLTLLHFKVSLRTLRSPTLHLRWRIKETHYALKKFIPEDGTLDVSQRGYDSVTLRSSAGVFLFLYFFLFFVEVILSDLLLRVNNLRPWCCHCAVEFLDVMLWQEGTVVCSNVS